jgi:hypothetical protein
MLSATLALVSGRATLQSSPIPTPIARPYLLRFVDNSTRVQIAYDNESQRDAHAAAVLMRGVAVTLAFDARGSV